MENPIKIDDLGETPLFSVPGSSKGVKFASHNHLCTRPDLQGGFLGPLLDISGDITSRSRVITPVTQL